MSHRLELLVHVPGNSALFLSDFDETLASDVVWGPAKNYERNFENCLRHSPRQNFVACPSLRGISPLFAKIDGRSIPCCARPLKGYRMINAPGLFWVLQRKLPYKNCLIYRNPDGLFLRKFKLFLHHNNEIHICYSGDHDTSLCKISRFKTVANSCYRMSKLWCQLETVDFCMLPTTQRRLISSKISLLGQLPM
jgi:hypothetical protein